MSTPSADAEGVGDVVSFQSQVLRLSAERANLKAWLMQTSVRLVLAQRQSGLAAQRAALLSETVAAQSARIEQLQAARPCGKDPPLPSHAAPDPAAPPSAAPPDRACPQQQAAPAAAPALCERCRSPSSAPVRSQPPTRGGCGRMDDDSAQSVRGGSKFACCVGTPRVLSEAQDQSGVALDRLSLEQQAARFQALAEGLAAAGRGGETAAERAGTVEAQLAAAIEAVDAAADRVARGAGARSAALEARVDAAAGAAAIRASALEARLAALEDTVAGAMRAEREALAREQAVREQALAQALRAHNRDCALTGRPFSSAPPQVFASDRTDWPSDGTGPLACEFLLPTASDVERAAGCCGSPRAAPSHSPSVLVVGAPPGLITDASPGVGRARAARRTCPGDDDCSMALHCVDSAADHSGHGRSSHKWQQAIVKAERTLDGDDVGARHRRSSSDASASQSSLGLHPPAPRHQRSASDASAPHESAPRLRAQTFKPSLHDSFDVDEWDGGFATPLASFADAAARGDSDRGDSPFAWDSAHLRNCEPSAVFSALAKAGDDFNGDVERAQSAPAIPAAPLDADGAGPGTPRRGSALRDFAALLSSQPERAAGGGGDVVSAVAMARVHAGPSLDSFVFETAQRQPDGGGELSSSIWDWDAASASEREVQRTSSLRPRDYVPTESFGNSLERSGTANSADLQCSDFELGTEFGTAASRASSVDLSAAALDAADVGGGAWEPEARGRLAGGVSRSEASVGIDTVVFDSKEQRLVRQVGLLQSLKDSILQDIAALDRRRLDALHAANQAEDVLRAVSPERHTLPSTCPMERIQAAVARQEAVSRAGGSPSAAAKTPERSAPASPSPRGGTDLGTGAGALARQGTSTGADAALSHKYSDASRTFSGGRLSTEVSGLSAVVAEAMRQSATEALAGDAQAEGILAPAASASAASSPHAGAAGPMTPTASTDASLARAAAAAAPSPARPLVEEMLLSEVRALRQQVSRLETELSTMSLEMYELRQNAGALGGHPIQVNLSSYENNVATDAAQRIAGMAGTLVAAVDSPVPTDTLIRTLSYELYNAANDLATLQTPPESPLTRSAAPPSPPSPASLDLPKMGLKCKVTAPSDEAPPPLPAANEPRSHAPQLSDSDNAAFDEWAPQLASQEEDDLAAPSALNNEVSIMGAIGDRPEAWLARREAALASDESSGSGRAPGLTLRIAVPRGAPQDAPDGACDARRQRSIDLCASWRTDDASPFASHSLAVTPRGTDASTPSRSGEMTARSSVCTPPGLPRTPPSGDRGAAALGPLSCGPRPQFGGEEQLTDVESFMRRAVSVPLLMPSQGDEGSGGTKYGSQLSLRGELPHWAMERQSTLRSPFGKSLHGSAPSVPQLERVQSQHSMLDNVDLLDRPPPAARSPPSPASPRHHSASHLLSPSVLGPLSASACRLIAHLPPDGAPLSPSASSPEASYHHPQLRTPTRFRMPPSGLGSSNSPSPAHLSQPQLSLWDQYTPPRTASPGRHGLFAHAFSSPGQFVPLAAYASPRDRPGSAELPSPGSSTHNFLAQLAISPEHGEPQFRRSVLSGSVGELRVARGASRSQMSTSLSAQALNSNPSSSHTAASSVASQDTSTHTVTELPSPFVSPISASGPPPQSRPPLLPRPGRVHSFDSPPASRWHHPSAGGGSLKRPPRSAGASAERAELPPFEAPADAACEAPGPSESVLDARSESSVGSGIPERYTSLTVQV